MSELDDQIADELNDLSELLEMEHDRLRDQWRKDWRNGRRGHCQYYDGFLDGLKMASQMVVGGRSWYPAPTE
jgi:hypothetical protein